MKTKELIYILPLDQDVKESLIDSYDTLDPEKKFEICDLLWDAYHTLFDQLLENNMNEEMERILAGNGEIDNTFYRRMREKTREQLQKENSGMLDEGKLAEARRAMEVIVKEIQAAKKN